MENKKKSAMEISNEIGFHGPTMITVNEYNNYSSTSLNELISEINSKGYFINMSQTDELGYGMKVVDDYWWEANCIHTQTRNHYSAYGETIEEAVYNLGNKIYEKEMSK
ncbi:MAG: hypothetical protein ACI35O_04005 [Bacillaceae bacterium]